MRLYALDIRDWKAHSTCGKTARESTRKHTYASPVLTKVRRRLLPMKLTRDTIGGLVLPPGKVDHIIWDDTMPGFGIRIRGDAKRWVVQYRVGRQQRREALGDTRKVSLEDARKVARKRFAQVELGVDPGAERAQADARALTLAVVITRYLDAKRGVSRPSTFKAAERYFAVHWKPLRNRPLDAIKRADIAARLQELVKVHGRTSAARARDYLSALFSWSMREGLCEANPVLVTNDPTEGILSRDRVLNDDEVRAIWNAAGDHDSGRIVKLLLLTGCRREEIGGLRWSEVSLDTGILTIPGTRTKNRHTLELTLPTMAIDILQSVSRRDGRDYVFGHRGGPFSGWSAAKLRLDARITIATGKPLAAWRLHDLRRTMRTGLGRVIEVDTRARSSRRWRSGPSMSSPWSRGARIRSSRCARRGQMAMKVNAIHVRAGGTKHGPGRDRWGPFEYAQAAIGVLYPDGISPSLFSTRTFKTTLVRDVRAQLRRDPMYRARGFRPIGRNTILRAANVQLTI
jgi:integrase